MFKKAKQNRVFQDVVDQIQESILNGRLKAGDVLPPERELREVFGISRGTLREALRVLEQKRLIDIRLGVNGGAVVKKASIEQTSESLALLIRFKKVSLDHLAEFRKGIEGLVVGLAAERATQEDVKVLKDLLAEVGNSVQKGVEYWDDFVRADEKIHLKFARISANPVYISVVQTIHDNIHRFYESYLPRELYVMHENYRDLEEITEAVAEGRASEASFLAQNHVRRNYHYMKTKNSQPTPD